MRIPTALRIGPRWRATPGFRQRAEWIATFLGAMWLVYGADWLVAPVGFVEYGLTPRTVWGLLGIAAMPFLHRGLGHLAGCSVCLLLLLPLAALAQTNFRSATVRLALLGGGLLWIFGRPTLHVGADCLIFSLIGVLWLAGRGRRNFIPALLAMLTAAGYLVVGLLTEAILPTQPASWDAPVCGLLAGAIWSWSAVLHSDG